MGRGRGSKAQWFNKKLHNRLLCPNKFKKCCAQVRHNCWWGYGETGSNTAYGSVAGTTPNRRQPGSYLLKLKMHKAFDPATLLPGIFPTDTLPQGPSDKWTRIFICSTVYNNKSLPTAPLTGRPSGKIVSGAMANIYWVLPAHEAIF